MVNINLIQLYALLVLNYSNLFVMYRKEDVKFVSTIGVGTSQ